MYKLMIDSVGKDGRQLEKKVFAFNEIDSLEYEHVMAEFSEEIFNLDIEFDVIEDDGDIRLDDLLIAASEADPFEEIFEGNHCTYIISGRMIF